jgi:hypothetical protein
MRLIIVFLVVLTSCSDASAEETSHSEAEAIAESILRDKIAISPTVGSSTNMIFLVEFNKHVYRAALLTEDKRMKALVAMRVLIDFPVLWRPGENMPTQEERYAIVAANPQFQLLKKWYLDLRKEEQEK